MSTTDPADLIKSISDDIAVIIRGEIELAKAELIPQAKSVGLGAGLFGGMVGFTKARAREVGSRNITVNCVAPGFIDTDMTKALPDVQRDALLGQIPLGRLGHVDEIAAAVAFLASPRAGYITGTTLHVNGGMYMN